MTTSTEPANDRFALTSFADERAASDLFQLYRDYVQHEDELINNRVGWFIQLHSFLIASYGIVVAAIMSSFFPQSAPIVAAWQPQAVACVLLIGIGVIGLQSSRSAKRSIDAADAAITALDEKWRHIAWRDGVGTVLPALIGGGADGVVGSGASFHMNLPSSVRWLWWTSFTIPIVFGWLGLSASIWPIASPQDLLLR